MGMGIGHDPGQEDIQKNPLVEICSASYVENTTEGLSKIKNRITI